MASSTDSYEAWKHEDLVQRVRVLELELKHANGRNKESIKARKERPVKKPKLFDWSKHSTRYIALKFAYLGQRYNGFEHHANNTTPLPTVEETLWLALMTAKLINPNANSSNDSSAVNWEGCDYSKCGRTDRGVSAFGQVIGLRVRSNRPLARKEDHATEEGDSTKQVTPETAAVAATEFDDVNDELPYIQILNGLLPSDIRALAWCPSPPEGFSARFSCRARHYKYFFTQPAFMPTPGVPGIRKSPFAASDAKDGIREGWLDIGRMQDAAKRFEGLHDFRNFCKVDPSKQINDHHRRIFRSIIRPLTPEEQPAAYVSDPHFVRTAQSSTDTNAAVMASQLAPSIYVFDLQGSAFLWHQVRHMISILFIIGQGLEEPALIDRLLDAPHCPEKPIYDLADESPLVLWDCVFPEEDPNADPLLDSLQWIYSGAKPAETTASIDTNQTRRDAGGSFGTKYGLGGAVDTVWSLWRASHMDAILRGSLLNLIARQPDALTVDPAYDQSQRSRKPFSQKVFAGASIPAYRGTYTPIMKRERTRAVDVQNAEYAAKRGLTPKPKKAADPRESRGDHMDVEPELE